MCVCAPPFYYTNKQVHVQLPDLQPLYNMLLLCVCYRIIPIIWIKCNFVLEWMFSKCNNIVQCFMQSNSVKYIQWKFMQVHFYCVHAYRLFSLCCITVVNVVLKVLKYTWCLCTTMLQRQRENSFTNCVLSSINKTAKQVIKIKNLKPFFEKFLSLIFSHDISTVPSPLIWLKEKRWN